jgi:hypothetical protein
MTQRYEIFWTSENGQGSIAGGIVEKHEIEEVSAAFFAEMLGQCANDEQRDGIRAGTIEAFPKED